MKQRPSQEHASRDTWAACVLVLFAMWLVCQFVVIPQVARYFQPSPFPALKDQISEGMTVEEVKEILGEPVKVEQLGKLVKEPIDFPLLDADGNPIDRDHISKAVDADRMLYFRIRRTTLVVRFGEDELVKSCYETFDLQQDGFQLD